MDAGDGGGMRADRSVDAIGPHDDVRSLRDVLDQTAREAERVGDPSAPFLRGLVMRCDIETQRDDRVEEMLETAERIAAGAIATRAAQELPGAIDRLTWERWIWSAVAAGVIVVAVAGSGYFIGRSAGKTEGAERAVYLEKALNKALSSDEASDWNVLIQYNDLAKVPRQCGPSPADGGRIRCAFTLWGGPAPAPAEQQAAGNVAGTTKPPPTGRKQ
jgi:hypothetical protein